MTSEANGISSNSASLPTLQLEILHLICQLLANQGRLKSLATLLLCSQSTFDLAAPFLHREITITRSNAPAIFAGIVIDNDQVRTWYSGNLQDPTKADWKGFLGERLGYYHKEWQDDYGADPERNMKQYCLWPDGSTDPHSEDLPSWLYENESDYYVNYSEDEEDQDTDEDTDKGASDEEKEEGGSKVELAKGLEAIHAGRGEHDESAKLLETECRNEWGTLRALQPTASSHKRKLALLGMVKRLTIAELPSGFISHLLKETFHSKVSIFENVSFLAIKAAAFWTFVNYAEYYYGNQHPFLDIWNSIRPDHACIQLPIPDGRLEKSFTLPRMLNDHYSKCTRHWFKQDEFRPPCDPAIFEDLLHIVLVNDLEGLLAEQLGMLTEEIHSSQLTLHNVVSIHADNLVAAPSIRVFFRSCYCREPRPGPSIAWCYACMNCRNGQERRKTAEDILVEIENNTKIEFIDVNWIGYEPDQEPSCRLPNIKITQNRSADTDFIEGVSGSLDCIDGDDAEPCACCGEKQLTQAECSVDPYSFATFQGCKIAGAENEE